jgi:hypothetical protein
MPQPTGSRFPETSIAPALVSTTLAQGSRDKLALPQGIPPERRAKLARLALAFNQPAHECAIN